MAAKQIEIADAIVELLNDDDFPSQFDSFEAERAYLPSFGVDELEHLQVVVVMGPQTHVRASRNSWEGNYTTFIGVFQKVDPTDVNQFDNLQELVQAMVDRIKDPTNKIDVAGSSLRSVSAGRGEAEAEALPFLLEHLQDKHTFTSVITVVHYVGDV